jgi:hypothetical protein
MGIKNQKVKKWKQQMSGKITDQWSYLGITGSIVVKEGVRPYTPGDILSSLE